MKSSTKSLLYLLALLLASGLQLHAAGPSERESIEWCDIWISHANETNLPRVLLIGDSICRDYYPEVEKRLVGKAYVARLATSRFISDPVLLNEVGLVLDQMSFDVIHFNNGMHGWQHSEQEYTRAFPIFFAAIRSHAPRAKLIWASTTPFKDQAASPSDGRITARNAIALEFLQPKSIPVDDLNALMRGHPEYYRDNVHFSPQGVRLQADQAAAQIQPLLSQ